MGSSHPDVYDFAGDYNLNVPKEIIDIENKIEEIKLIKNQVDKNQKYEEAAKLRDSERKLIAELEKEKEKWIKSSKKKRDKVA